MRQRRCCAMMASGACSLVRRNVAIGGGIVMAILAIASSEMTPGPLGIAETKPMAEAPQAIASAASEGDLMQQILTLGRVCMVHVEPPLTISAGSQPPLTLHLCLTEQAGSGTLDAVRRETS